MKTPPRKRIEIAVAWGLRVDWRAGPTLRRAAEYALRQEGFRRGRLSIAVVGDRAMSRLHERHLAIPGPTDVLTFDFGSAPPTIEAEIVVCGHVALRAARGSRSEAIRELALYVTHGVLHVAGYDDHTPEGFTRMHAREFALLKRQKLTPRRVIEELS